MERQLQKEIEGQPLKSNPTYTNSLNLSQIPVTDVSVLGTRIEQYFPSFNESNFLEFYIQGDSQHYIDLSNTFLYMRLKLTDKAGEPLTSSATSVANCIFSTMFQSLDLLINNVNICTGSNLYAYSAYLNKLINYGAQSRKTKLRSELFFKETTGTALDTTNKAYEKLKEISSQESFEVYSKLSHPLFFQDKLLPPGFSLRIRLRRSPVQFCLLSTALTEGSVFDEQLKIMDTYMDVKKVIVNSKIESMHQQILNKGQRLYYPFFDYQTLSFVVSKGSLQFTSETLMTEVPQFAIVAITNSKGFNGEISRSPFDFKSNGLSSVHMTVNGEKQMMSNMNMSIDNKQYMRLYRLFCDVISSHGEMSDLTVEDYVSNTYFLVPVNWSNTGKEDRFALQKTGNVKVHLTFESDTASNLNVLFYYVTPKILSIDKSHVYIN